MPSTITKKLLSLRILLLKWHLKAIYCHKDLWLLQSCSNSVWCPFPENACSVAFPSMQRLSRLLLRDYSQVKNKGRDTLVFQK